MLAIKFNHGVEIGARLAYLGHYRATKDKNVLKIANDELDHRTDLLLILQECGTQPSDIIDGVFTLIGTGVYWACQVSPRWALNRVATLLEVFAIFSYRKLAKWYPQYKTTFLMMATTEDEHRRYFEGAE